MQKTLILGLGNDILCDDGIGMKLARDLEKLAAAKIGTAPIFQDKKEKNRSCPYFCGCVPNFADFSFLPASIDGLELLDAMDGYDKVFIIDAFQAKDLEIGEVAVLGVEDFEHTVYIGSPHSLNLATAIKLCRGERPLALTIYNIPEEIVIIAVNVFDTQTFSENLSPQLQEKYPQILNRVKEIINIL